MALLELRIKNFVLVETAELNFGPGLNIITGETGAGKSLLVGAINLLIGTKTDWDLITGKDRSEIVGIFEGNEETEKLLEDHGIEHEGDIIIRRVLTPEQRKSRAFVNMTPVTQQFLRNLTSGLVDIHGQHEHQKLFDVSSHLEYLDKFAETVALKERVSRLFKEYQEILRKFEKEKREVENTEKLKDFLEYQLRELEDADLKEGEEEELEERIKVLSNLETLRGGIQEALSLIYEDDDSAYSRLTRVLNILRNLSGIDESLKSREITLEEVLIRIEELWRNLLDYSGKLHSEPEELDRLMERLSLINRLKEKYRTDVPGLLKLYNETLEKVRKIEVKDEFLRELETRVRDKYDELMDLARTLSKRRKGAAREFEDQVLKELSELGMQNAVFVVDFKEKEVDETGIDQVEFLISTNPGEEPKPLRKVASGGELSRIMLALKTVLSEIDDIPTLIFDEIDVGIGGRIAEAVGKKLASISKKGQVITITHLPQIAVYGSKHFVVEKIVSGGRTVTRVRELTGDERVKEIARMLAGEKITESSIVHARELLKNAGQM